MSTVRIKDVAKHAGVSEATITRVVNNKGYVAEETRKRVLKSIDDLEYIPSRMASALRNNRTGIIYNILPLDRDNPFFSSIVVSLKRAAIKYDYQILPLYNETDRSRDDGLLRTAASGMAEGIIFTAKVFSSPGAVKEVLDKDIPVIMIERPLNMKGVDKIFLDDFAGSSAAAEKFLALGHRNFGFIGRELQSQAVEHNRFNGYRQTLEKSGGALHEKMIVIARDYTVEYGYEAMKQILKRDGRRQLTACFIASDVLACGALQCLYDARLRVPEDISIIGYDNTLSTLCSPPITSVAFPYDEIGVTAISLFRERREQGRGFDKTVILSPFIMDRGSVADIRKKPANCQNSARFIHSAKVTPGIRRGGSTAGATEEDTTAGV
jgi:LacI family transcriptional regulator